MTAIMFLALAALLVGVALWNYYHSFERDLGGRLALVMALVLAQETEGHPHTHDIPPLGLTIDLSDKAIDED